MIVMSIKIIMTGIITGNDDNDIKMTNDGNNMYHESNGGDKRILTHNYHND